MYKNIMEMMEMMSVARFVLEIFLNISIKSCLNKLLNDDLNNESKQREEEKTSYSN